MKKIECNNCYRFPRWFTLVAGLMLCGCGGTPYLFGVYSPAMKTILGYNQSEMNLIGIFPTIGGCFAIFLGFLLDHAGPKPTGLVGGLGIGCGYLLLWLGVTHRIVSNYLLMAAGTALIGFGSSGLYASSVGPNIANFAVSDTGRIVGILASMYGLSGAIFTQIYKIAFKPDVVEFLFFLAVGLSSVSAFAIIFVNYVPQEEKNTSDEKTSLLPTKDEENEATVPSVAERQQSLLATKNALSDKEEEDLWNPQTRSVEMLLQLNFWIFVPAYIIPGATGMVVITNVGSILLSLGGHDGSQDNLVILLSIFNCAGRIIFGLLSDGLSRWIHRPGFIVLSSLLMACTSVVMAYVTASTLWIGIVLVGIAYGGLCAICPIIISEIWGSKHWGANYAISCMIPAGGNYIFSVLLAGKLYERYTRAGSNQCFGKECYQYSFFITTGLCLVAALFGLALYHRTRKLYEIRRLLNLKRNLVIH